MSASINLVDESVDDGIPPNFLNDFLGDMDNLGLKVCNDLSQTEQIVQERLKKFNEAWHIPPSRAEMPSTSARFNEPQPGPSRLSATPAENKQEEFIPIELPAQPANQSAITSVQGVLGSPSSMQIVEEAPRPSTPTDGSRGRVPSNGGAANGGRHSVRRRRSYSEDDDVDEDDYEYRRWRAARSRRHRSRYRSRSRSPPEPRRSRPFRSRSPPRSRSRFPNRSPPRRQRSRTPPRSRSASRESRSSRSSERDRRHRRHRGDHPAMQATPAIPAVPDVSMMAQTMMSMMQMFNQCAAATNPMQPMLPLAFGNLLQTAQAGLTPPNLMNPLAPPAAAASKEPSANAGSSSRIHPQQPERNDVRNESLYDGTTELFLEGRMHFGQYLRENPSGMVEQKVNPRVYERIKEAIYVLDRQETKEQIAKFLYVPPYYYGETRKKENRSPLIWNDQNVLFGLTSNAREVKHCEPFGNVNGKLKGLIAKLGLDEGAISQQLHRNALAPVNDRIAERDSSSRIQAISTLPPKPGSARVRHVIERAAQTEGYACGECVERAKKTFVSGGSQTMSIVSRMADAAIQTAVPIERNPVVPSIPLEGLTASQIETIEAIVRFIRTRHVTGPVDAVQHALSKDSTARLTMGQRLFQTAHDAISMMTENPRPVASPYASSSSTSRYVVSIQQNVQTSRAGFTSPSFQPQIPSPPPPTAGGRYFQAFNNQASILPACYAPQQHMSKKAKKKLNKR